MPRLPRGMSKAEAIRLGKRPLGETSDLLQDTLLDSDDQSRVPAWAKGMEQRLASNRDDRLGELDAKITALQQEITRKSKKSRTPALKFESNMRYFDFLNEVEDVFADIESKLRIEKHLSPSLQQSIDKGNSLIDNRKQLVIIRDRDGPRVAECFELGSLASDNDKRLRQARKLALEWGSGQGRQRRSFGMTGLCFICQRPGHMAAQCPTKSLVSPAPQQLRLPLPSNPNAVFYNRS